MRQRHLEEALSRALCSNYWLPVQWCIRAIRYYLSLAGVCLLIDIFLDSRDADEVLVLEVILAIILAVIYAATCKRVLSLASAGTTLNVSIVGIKPEEIEILMTAPKKSKMIDIL